jgi:hypothetical protein
VKLSWATIDRFCQEEADTKEDVRRELERTGRDDRRPEADTNAAAGDLFNRAGFALAAVDARGTGASFGAREIKRLR